MKTWKSIMMMCALMTAGLAFTSCEKDDSQPEPAHAIESLAVAGSYTGTFELHQPTLCQVYSGQVTLSVDTATTALCTFSTSDNNFKAAFKEALFEENGLTKKFTFNLVNESGRYILASEDGWLGSLSTGGTLHLALPTADGFFYFTSK